MRRVFAVVAYAGRRVDRWLEVRSLKKQLVGAQPLFDAKWYLRKNPDVRLSGYDPYKHYLDHGRAEGRSPNRYAINPDGLPPRPPSRRQQRALNEQRQIVMRSGLFDAEWYAYRYNVEAAEALDHFITRGSFAGYDPNPFFSTLSYYEANPDIAAFGMNALCHYIAFGIIEKRNGHLNKRMAVRARLTETTWRTGRFIEH